MMATLDRPRVESSSLSRLEIGVRRKLNFDQVMKKPRETKADRYQTGKREPSAARRCLDFGETDPSVVFSLPDLLPDQSSGEDSSFHVKRTCLTYQMKTALEELFQRRKFPNKKKKVALAIELGVTELEVQMWFRNRRQKWKQQHNGGQFQELITARPRTPFHRSFLKLSPETSQVLGRDSIITAPVQRGQSSVDLFDSLPASLQAYASSDSRELIDLKSNLKGSLEEDRITYKNKQVRILRQL